jgi:hypothetical protein
MTTTGRSYNISPNEAQSNGAPVSVRTFAQQSTYNLPANATNTANGAGTDLYNLSVSDLCPVVGYAYQITLNVSYSLDFAGVPTAGGAVYLRFSYGANSGAGVIQLAQIGGPTPLDPYAINGSMTLTFNHTAASNKLIISNSNSSGQTITGATSLVQVQNLAVVSLGPITSTIPTSVFT